MNSKSIEIIRILCLMMIITSILGEYNIKDEVTSYLYQKFDNVEDDIFPHDVRINISLSRVSGTLLYSVDRRMNQLIVSLYDGVDADVLVVEFRKKEIRLSLQQLCGCLECRYIPLDLRIQIRESIFLQCNGRSLQEYKYAKILGWNKVYPLMYSLNDTNVSLPNEAHLWLVNTPQHQDLYPNSEQLMGCIFNVKYDNKPLIFSKTIGTNEGICKKVCNSDICNGGDCFETYNGMPLCNCTKTFLNGPYCNKSILSINKRSISQKFQFEIFKLSWKSSSKNIFILNNSMVQLALRFKLQKLILEYQYMNGYTQHSATILSTHYVPMKQYVLVVFFSTSTVDVFFLNDGSWKKSVLPTYINLSRQKFTSLTLRSGDGDINLLYKRNSRDITWQETYIGRYEELGSEKESTTHPTTTTEKRAETQSWMFKNKVPIIITFILIPGLIITLYFLIKYKRKSSKRISGETDQCDPEMKMKGTTGETDQCDPEMKEDLGGNNNDKNNASAREDRNLKEGKETNEEQTQQLLPIA